MKINISSPNFKADEKLLNYAETKFSKLENYFDHIIEGAITFRLENTGKVQDKVVELKLKVPGETLFVDETQKSFESAVDFSVDNMKRILIKYKEKMRKH